MKINVLHLCFYKPLLFRQAYANVVLLEACATSILEDEPNANILY